MLQTSMSIDRPEVKPKLASGLINLERHTCYRLGRC